MSITVYWAGMALLALYWIAVVVAVVAEDREPSVSLSWILILGLLPGVGLIIYFLGGRNWKGIHSKQKWVRDLRTIEAPFMEPIYSRYREYSEAVTTKYRGTPTERLIRAISTERGNDPLPANELTIWPTGEAYFPLLIDDISNARSFIHMQYYEWERDELTAKICDGLMERAEAGVEVRILNDFLGCMQYKKDQLNALKAVGAHVGSDVTQIGRLNYRNHRKITVIDGMIGHSGTVPACLRRLPGNNRLGGKRWAAQPITWTGGIFTWTVAKSVS